MTLLGRAFVTQKSKMLCLSLFIIGVALAFNVALSTFSIKTIYVQSIDSFHHVVLLDFKRKIQTALSFGKRIENFIGIEELIDQTRTEFSSIAGIALYNAKGERIATHTDDAKDSLSTIGQIYPFDAPFYTVEATPFRHYCTTIKNSFSAKVEGYICMHVDETIMEERVQSHLMQSLLYLTVVFILGAVVFTLILTRIDFKDAPKKYQKQITIILISISLVSQIAFTWLNLRLFYQEYHNDINTKNTLLVSLLKSDVENFLAKKLPIDKIINIETLMAQMIVIGSDVERLVISNAQQQPLYDVHKDGTTQDEGLLRFRDADIAMPLYQKEELETKNIVGYIFAFKDTKQVNAYIKDVLINLLTIAFVSVVFMYEFIQFLFFFFAKNSAVSTTSSPDTAMGYRLIRPIIFLFMFTFDLTLSFLTIFAGTLYEVGIGISKEMAMGLPLSVEMFFAAMAFIVGGKWSARYSWMRFFTLGILGVSLGALFSAFSQTLPLFLGSRALIGFGYGLVISSLQSYIIQNTDHTHRTQAFGIMLAGLYSGSLCGSATGAILADLVGYKALFFISGLLVLGVLLFLRYLNHAATPQALHVEGETQISFWTFIRNKNVMGFLLLSAIPASAIAVGYVYYFIPIQMQAIGSSQADIGRVILLYSIVIIYLAPFFGALADTVKDKRLIIALSTLVGGLGLIGYYTIEAKSVAILLSALLLGISAGLGYASQMTFASNLKASLAYGASNSMGTIRSIERGGQVIGPLLFASLGASFGGSVAVLMVGVGTLLLAVAFYGIVQKEQ